MPKVSVVVATYNGSRTLLNCLDSLARLNYPDYEVIVVDDGSTDDTAAVAEEWGRQGRGDVEFTLLRQAHAGASAARNRGVAACRGEWIGFLDSDCELPPDSVAVRAAAPP